MFVYGGNLIGFDGKNKNGWVLVNRNRSYSEVVCEIIKICDLRIKKCSGYSKVCLGFYGLHFDKKDMYDIIKILSECSRDGIECDRVRSFFASSKSFEGCYDLFVAMHLDSNIQPTEDTDTDTYMNYLELPSEFYSRVGVCL